VYTYTGCFTTLGQKCRRWFPRSLWSKMFIQTYVRFWTVMELWPLFHSPTRPHVNLVCHHTSSLSAPWMVRGAQGEARWLGMSGGFDQLILWRSCYSRGKQPSGSLRCGRRWHFRKSTLSTDKLKLKVADWWSTGILTCELIAGYHPFDVDRNYAEQVFNGYGKLLSVFSFLGGSNCDLSLGHCYR
jgi:serine/threonine protein kinase